MAPKNDLRFTVRDFLNSIDRAEVLHCEYCGLLMEHVSATLVFDGSTWEVALPFCRFCTPGASDKAS